MTSNQMHPRSRKGKTLRDRKRGVFAKNIANKSARADWQNNHEHQHGLREFPWATCNGKRNRYLIALRGQGTDKNPLYKHATHK
jgi:hypothetical protein